MRETSQKVGQAAVDRSFNLRNSTYMTNPDLRNLLSKRGLRLSDLAELLGVHKSQVTRWVQKGIPASRVIEVERASGIKRKHLRPDLYA